MKIKYEFNSIKFLLESLRISLKADENDYNQNGWFEYNFFLRLPYQDVVEPRSLEFSTLSFI